MSFQNVKPTKPELNRVKKKKKFSVRGANLLEIKREQLLNLLRKYMNQYFELKTKMRNQLLEDIDLFEKTYETIGKAKISRIARLNEEMLNPEIKITYYHDMGVDIPKIELKLPEYQLPTYSYSDTNLYIDILISRLREIIFIIIKLGEMDSLLYHVAEENKKVQRRIDALDEIIIPRLESIIRSIEEILGDEEREEFIRMKKIKENLENKNIKGEI